MNEKEIKMCEKFRSDVSIFTGEVACLIENIELGNLDEIEDATEMVKARLKRLKDQEFEFKKTLEDI